VKVIGITGSSGAGKTTLSKILNEREDVKVIDADKVVKEMSVPGAEYLKAIEETFGKEILLEDGNLNRKALAYKIYNNNSARENLNNLTFKYVVNEILERIKNVKDEKVKIIAIDAPLLFESGLDKYCDSVVALVADKELKIKRICQRDNIDEKTAESRLNIQHENEYYTHKADYVITNKANCNLKAEIEKIMEIE
jgi:dephospho-CoA kinase